MANINFTERSGLQDSIFGKSQEPIKMFLEKRGEAFEQTSMLPELFNMGSSNHWGEKFSTMTAMDGFQPVGENGDYPVDGMQEGFDKFLEHMTWKNSALPSCSCRAEKRLHFSAAVRSRAKCHRPFS